MSQEGPVLSQLMIRYPFTPHSRQFFDKLPIQESFASNEVLRQAENRLLASIGRVRYEPHISELIEFSSFFVAALVASQESYLGLKFAEREGTLAKGFFLKEKAAEKLQIVGECFGVKVAFEFDDSGAPGYSMRVEDYLAVVTKFELGRLQRWKLVNQPLYMGILHFGENAINDLFADLAEKMIRDGVKNLRRIPFPRELVGLRDGILPFLPPPKVKSTTGYLYIDELLKHPVSDGRHRLVWMVLAPYLVNVRNLGDEEAVEKIKAFVGQGISSDMKRFIEYNVKRAKRNGLMPPALNKMKTEHPDLYSLLPKEITQKYRRET